MLLGEKISLSRRWNIARPQIQDYFNELYECCIETGVSTGLAEGSYISTFWAAGVPIICELMVVVLTDNTVKWSFDAGLNWVIVHDPTPVALPQTGMVTEFAGDENNVPTGWLLCDGLAVSRTTYADLFAIVSTTYGVGDGSATFNLPDIRGKTPIGVNNANYSAGVDGSLSTRNLGAIVGAENHTILTAELPSHRHTTKASGSANGEGTGGLTAISGTSASGSTGGDTAHNNTQPTHVINYIIKT